MADTVLIVGEDGDRSADAVAVELDTRGVRSFRFDTADFPRRVRVSANFGQDRPLRWSGEIEAAEGRLALDDVIAVYYRKPRDFEFPPAMSEPERLFARAQARVGLGGVLSSMSVRWINHPAAIADAEYKPRQLVAAARCGLTTPPTLITNDPAEVRGFAAGNSPLVVKPLAAPIVHEGGGYSAVYTRIITEDDLADLGGVQVTAHLFQKFVKKSHEIRVTVVGERLFPVAIHAGSDASRIDWRTDYDTLSYEVVNCPDSVVEGITRYLKSEGLVYGAFDFVCAQETSDWVMLECNAAGQWGWLAEECNLPIAAAIADELLRVQS